MSIPSLQQNSQDISAYYLAQIYKQTSQLNGSNVSIPSSLPDPAIPFTPPASAVWVSGLWFLSLVISLTCAVLSTLLQQWARRYLMVAYPRYSPHKRARIRTFYKEGVDKLHMPWTVDALPALLHISLFLFFAGVSVFLFTVNLTIFKAVIVWVGLSVAGYAILTLLPIIYKYSPYAAPLSTAVSFCLTGTRHACYQFLRRFGPSICMPFCNRDRKEDDTISLSMRGNAEKFAFNLDPDIDYRALSWTFGTLDEDKELEQFFEGVPGLCRSRAVPRALKGFVEPNQDELRNALTGLMDRTLSSNLVSDFVKKRRVIICTKVVEVTSLFGPWWLMDRVLREWRSFLGCIEFGLFVKKWRGVTHPVTLFYAQCVAAVTIWTVRERDERWLQLTSSQLNASKSLIQNYLAHGDSVLLANVNLIVRQTVLTYSGSAHDHRNGILATSSKVLDTVCKLHIQHTLPELQHGFCSLWNQLVQTARSDQRDHVVFVCTMALKNIRKLYAALHEGTGARPTTLSATADDHPALDDASSYLECTIPEHCPDLSSLGRPELQLDESAHDAAGNAPLTSAILPVAAPLSPLTQVPSTASPTPSHNPYTITPAALSPVPTHDSASHLDLQSNLAAAPSLGTISTVA